MKNVILSLALVLGTTSAFAGSNVKVCSVGRAGQIYTTEFIVDGDRVTMVVDGEVLEYQVDSVRGANLKRASAMAGERVIQATQYVISSPHSTTTLQIAKGVSQADYMLFPAIGLMGPTSKNCK